MIRFDTISLINEVYTEKLEITYVLEDDVLSMKHSYKSHLLEIKKTTTT